MENNMPSAGTISNETILEFLRDFKCDMHRRFEEVDKRFEQVDKRFEQMQQNMDMRFEQVDKRFEQMDRELAGIHKTIQEEKTKLDKLYDARDTLKISFSKMAFGINIILTAIIATIISLAL
jgi:archaellum component FlaC